VVATVGSLAAAPVVLGANTALLPGAAAQAKLLEDVLSVLLASSAAPLVLVLVPAFAEELLYRGAIQGLLQRSGRPMMAIAVQAAMFSVVHTLRARTGSLCPSMRTHAAINAAVFGALWFDGS